MPNGATKQNIEQYMESLRLLTLENKNTPLIKQAKDLLIKIDVA